MENENKNKFIIHKINYLDSLGNPVSQEAFDQERQLFEELLEANYEKEVLKIIDTIPENATPLDSLKTIFDYLLENIKYDHNLIYNSDGTVQQKIYKTHNNWGIESDSKVAPLLTGKGICAGIAPMISDFCARLHIDSKEISGKTKIIDKENSTRISHVWNLVNIDGEYKHLDLVYALYNLEDGRNPYDFFLISDKKLKEIAPHSDYENQLPNNMMTEKYQGETR